MTCCAMTCLILCILNLQTPIHATGAQGQDQGAQAGVRMVQGMAQGAATAQPMPARSSPKSNLDWEYYQGVGGFGLPAS
jgi:hypothetical protein